jgi:hypothetical protein
VRRIVVGQVHRDDDSVEVANLWHIVSFLLFLTVQRYEIIFYITKS